MVNYLGSRTRDIEMTDVFILYTIHYLDIHSQQERMAFTIPTVSIITITRLKFSTSIAL
jgi:hypothetical protein